jgi:hypothetical protein
MVGASFIFYFEPRIFVWTVINPYINCCFRFTNDKTKWICIWKIHRFFFADSFSILNGTYCFNIFTHTTWRRMGKCPLWKRFVLKLYTSKLIMRQLKSSTLHFLHLNKLTGGLHVYALFACGVNKRKVNNSFFFTITQTLDWRDTKRYRHIVRCGIYYAKIKTEIQAGRINYKMDLEKQKLYIERSNVFV